MCDADIDGAHMDVDADLPLAVCGPPEMVTCISLAPLPADHGQVSRYVYSDEERDEVMSELQETIPTQRSECKVQGTGRMDPTTVGDHHEPTDQNCVESHSQGRRGLRRHSRPHGGGCPRSKIVHERNAKEVTNLDI